MKEFELTFFSLLFKIVLCLVSIKCLKYFWNRRWFYYYSFQIPGPFFLPIIGVAYKLLKSRKNMNKAFVNILKTQPPIFKVWLGLEVMVITSRPRDLKIILSKCFERGYIAEFGHPIIGNALLTARQAKWSKNRKIINPTFNSFTLHSFIGDFSKHSNKLVEKLENYCDLDSFDILLSVFCCAFDTTCESLLDIDASLIDGQEDFIKNLMKMEDLVVTRLLKMWSGFDFFWKPCFEAIEIEVSSKKNFDYTKKLIEIKKSQNISQDPVRQKRFLNHLLNNPDTKLDDETILHETHNMLIEASETESLSISLILIILGIHSEIQEKVYREIVSVAGNSKEEITLEHINQMPYLEAVIKEVLRIFPIVPATIRQATEDIKLDDYTIPTGAHIGIPIFYVQKLPEYWIDPETFNPDRFLSKELDLPPCVYMPFSYGGRNCLGYRYAMLFVKVLLSTLLRSYMFESVDYKSIEDIKFYYQVVIKPKKGYKVRLQKKRKK